MVGTRVSLVIAGACISLVGMAIACSSDKFGTTTDQPDATTVDAGEESISACDPKAPFGELHSVRGVDKIDLSATLTADELTLYATVWTPAGSKITMATRPTVDAPFGDLIPVFPQLEGSPSYPHVSSDGTELFFAFIPKVDAGMVPFADIYRGKSNDLANSQRLSVNINDEKLGDVGPYLTPRRLYFMRGDVNLPYNYRIVSALRSSDGFGTIDELKGLGRSQYTNDQLPVVTPDDRVLFFARAVEENTFHIFSATRADPDAPFENVAPVSELNKEPRQFPLWISPDGCKIYVAVYTKIADKTILRYARRP